MKIYVLNPLQRKMHDYFFLKFFKEKQITTLKVKLEKESYETKTITGQNTC
jgi:hypothetical protein